MGYSIVFARSTLSTLLIDNPSTASNLPQEGSSPLSKVEYLYKKGGDTFDRLAFYNTLVGDTAVLTSYSWSLGLNSLNFRSDLESVFLSSAIAL